MSNLVYHYTDTARLPWILLSGELRPGKNKIGGFPDPDFLWATTSAMGDRSSSASQSAFRNGNTRAVRFVLEGADFRAWRDIASDYPAWTPDQIDRLERLVRGVSSPRDWRCRAEPLARSRWLRVETRTYQNKAWIPILTSDLVPELDGEWAGISIAGTTYVSREIAGPHGQTGYQIGIRVRAAA